MNKEDVRDVLVGVDIEKVVTWLAVGIDGHAISDPSYFIDMGFSREFVMKYAEVHQSGSGKYQLLDSDGQPTQYAFGVWQRAFVMALGSLIDARWTAACGDIGRGSSARARAETCLEKLQEVGLTTQEFIQSLRDEEKAHIDAWCEAQLQAHKERKAREEATV